MACPNLPPGFDFTDPDIYVERLPVDELAELRRTAPIWWNEQRIGKNRTRSCLPALCSARPLFALARSPSAACHCFTRWVSAI